MKKFIDISMSVVFLLIALITTFIVVYEADRKTINLANLSRSTETEKIEKQSRVIYGVSEDIENNEYTINEYAYLTYLPQNIKYSESSMFVYATSEYFNELPKNKEGSYDIDCDIDDKDYISITDYEYIEDPENRRASFFDRMVFGISTEFVRSDASAKLGLSHVNLVFRQRLKDAQYIKVLEEKELDAEDTEFERIYFVKYKQKKDHANDPVAMIYCMKTVAGENNVALTVLHWANFDCVSNAELLKVIQGIKVQ